MLGAPYQRTKVLQHVRLGSYAEDLDFVTKGAYGNHIIILGRSEVFGLPGEGLEDSTARKLFDLREVPIPSNPQGIAYVESEDLFVVVTGEQPDVMYFVDHRGNYMGSRDITYPVGYVPTHSEGLAYIPMASPFYPDHLVLATMVSFGDSRLEIINRGGQVVAELKFDASNPLYYAAFAGVAYLAPDRLIAYSFTYDDVYIFDFDGNVVGGPFAAPATIPLEGLVQTRSGYVVGAGQGGRLYYYDQDFNQPPLMEVIYQANVGALEHFILGLAWNSDTNEHLVSDFSGDPVTYKIRALPPSLHGYSVVADLGTFYRRANGLAYMPDEHRYAVGHRRVGNLPTPIILNSILLFSAADTLAETIDLTALSDTLGLGQPTRIAYIPSTRQFAVRFLNAPTVLYVLSRTGSLDRTIDLAASAGITDLGSFTFFNPVHSSGGQFMIISNDRRILITDFNGVALREFNALTEFGFLEPELVSAVTTGPQAGAFSCVDADGEMVVFKLK